MFELEIVKACLLESVAGDALHNGRKRTTIIDRDPIGFNLFSTYTHLSRGYFLVVNLPTYLLHLRLMCVCGLISGTRLGDLLE